MLSEDNQRKVVEFCKANHLLLLADEVRFPFPLFLWILEVLNKFSTNGESENIYSSICDKSWWMHTQMYVRTKHGGIYTQMYNDIVKWGKTHGGCIHKCML